MIALIKTCRPNILLCHAVVASMACKNGIIIILPNKQDKLSCKYLVLGVHTEISKYPMYHQMELGIGDQKYTMKLREISKQ